MQPEDGATDVPPCSLGVAAARTPNTDVISRTVIEDVNSASRPIRWVLVSQNQAGVEFDPPGVLALGQTYYWRIDEVNGAPDNTIFKGDVWSFTTEPVAYPIQNVVATSNGISEGLSGPERTVDGSGLNAADQHSDIANDMWLAMAPEGEALYIQYEFDGVYKLHELLVWNYNVQFEMISVRTKVDGRYSENGGLDALVDVEFVRLNARTRTSIHGGDLRRPARLRPPDVTRWGMMAQYGLSEVRFTYIPVQAREPQPADGATEVEPDTVLSWRAGREAVEHQVYLGTDPDALTLAGTSDAPSFDPGSLDLGTTYYWRIDEVNETQAVTTWAGPLWSFATQDYIVVDDFEGYNDDVDAGTTIFDTWIDGWVNDTGSTVGYLNAPFAERTIVHGGRQAMPLFYDNTAAAVSDRVRPGPDWTVMDAQPVLTSTRRGQRAAVRQDRQCQGV